MKHDPKTWAELRKLVADNIATIIVPINKMPGDIPQWLAASPLSLNAKADEQIAFFVKHGRWRKAEGDLRIMLFLRSLFAAEAFLSREHRAYPGPADGTSMIHLEQFLTSTWYHDWQRWAQMHFGVEWNFPFDPWSLN